jgi:excinuclease UvrABC helicase subunit UvrB
LKQVGFQRLNFFPKKLINNQKLKKFDNIEIMANLYNSLGSAYQLQSKNLDSVEYYYKKCIDLITNPELDYYRLAAYINISDVYVEKNKSSYNRQIKFRRRRVFINLMFE